ncbi:type II toxin-antitoxin system VapC family toxin [Bosea sp. (in: a-proteobacteria)]|uniref:type II toxin-antitoxin system VapC family toxin n=1 Tax=Bosea sp. (in: a-proteobacteria) TaxID=1871050 RepID=UPI0025BE3BC0|nr:type II toxin-antitoxin system VapC family toxin [Bosea sp. (in: a-proteobacteria)]
MIGLDTNAVIHAINGRKPAMRRRLQDCLAQGMPVGVPAIVLSEVWYGIRKSARPEVNTALLEGFLALDVTPWPFEPADAEEAGDIRIVLERAGHTIGPHDILIAAQARRRGAVLVTGNLGEFSRVPRLKTEDWGK